MGTRIQKEIIESEVRTTGGKQVQDDIIKVRTALHDLNKEQESLLHIRNKLQSEGKKNTEEWKRNEEAITANKNAILKNKDQLGKLNSQIKITDMSYSQLSKRATELRSHLNNISKATDPQKWAKYNSELIQVQSQMTKVKAGSQQVGSMFGSLTKAAGMLGIGLGGAFGVIKLGKSIIESTDNTADKFEVTIGKLNAGFTYLKRSIATLDFKNFTTNMVLAIRLGEEYIKQKQEIEDRTMALTVTESEFNVEKQKQLKILRDETKSNTERIAAARAIIELENKLAQTRASIAEQAKNAKVNSLLVLGITEKTIIDNLKNYETNKKIIAQADEYNKLLEDRQALENTPVANPRYSMFTNFSAKPIDKTKAELDAKISATSEAVKQFAEMRRKYVNMSEEELQEITQLYVNWYNAIASADENTQKVSSRMSSLLAQEMNIGNSDNGSAKNTKREEPNLEMITSITGRVKEAEIDTAAFIIKMYEDLYKRKKQFAEDELKLYEQAQLKKNEFIQEYENKSLEDMRDSALKSLDQKYNDIISNEQLTNEERLKLTETYEGAKKGIETQYATEKLELIKEQTALINGFFSASAELVDTLRNNEIAKIEAEYDKKIQLAQADKNLVASLEEAKEEKIKGVKKKYANVDFNLKILQINASTAQAIMSVWGNNTLPYPFAAVFNGIMSALITAKGVAEAVAAKKARDTAMGLYTGGYTGDGGKYEPAGTVHRGEYVIASDELNNPGIRKMVTDFIEPVRMRRLDYSTYAQSTTLPKGFAQGGFTGSSENTTLVSIDNTLTRLNRFMANLEANGVVSIFDESKIYELRKRVKKQEIMDNRASR